MSQENSKPLLDRIRLAAKAAGKSPTAVSREAVGHEDAIRNIERSKGGGATLTTLTALARVLGVSVEWLATGEGDAPTEATLADTRETGAPAQGGARRPPRRRSDDVVPAEVAFNRAGAPRDVPIYGTAAGSTLTGAGNGDVAVAAFQMEENPVSWALRPPALVGAKDIYALYVVNESMSPRHPPGDLVFVDPNRPVRFGDSCILHVQDAPHHDMQHLIAMFLRRTERTVDVQKLNPESVVSFPRGVVVRMHRVLTNNELFGV